MMPRTTSRTAAIVGLALVLVFLGSCAGGVPQSEYEAARQQAADQEQKATAFQQQLSEQERTVAELQQQLATLEQEAAAQSESVAALGDVTVLIGARPAPIPTPRPTPTPLPPGVEPPPPPEAPAFYDEQVPFFFYVETLATGSVSRYGFASFPSCVPNSVFKRGTKLVWRFEIIDTSTQKRLTDTDEVEVTVILPHGEELTGRFSQRGGGRVPDAPWMWAAAWDIPPDYPLGALDYTIRVTTEDGRTGTFEQPALVSETADSRVQILD
jgi:hypothetical protein